MSEPEKAFYKVKYEFEMKVSVEEEKDAEPFFQISIDPSIEILTRETGSNGQSLSNVFDYIEKHFPGQVDELYRRMFVEGVAMCLGPSRSPYRKKLISKILQKTETGLRKRIVTPKGATPKRARSDFEKKREQFILKCTKVIKKLQNDKKKITQTAVGTKYFLTVTNEPLSRRLKKELDLYEISFKDLVKNRPNNLT